MSNQKIDFSRLLGKKFLGVYQGKEYGEHLSQFGNVLNVLLKKDCFQGKQLLLERHDLPDGENFELHRPWIDEVVINCSQMSKQDGKGIICFGYLA